MNGIEILKKDHRTVDSLFHQIKMETEFNKKLDFFHLIQHELLTHTYIEEKYLYPFFAEKEGFQDEIQHSFDEHQEIKSLLKLIQKEKESNEFDNLMADLIHSVKHHVQEEEEALFPKIEKNLTQDQLEILGRRFEEGKIDCLKNSVFAA